jgi:hypothetical protein
MPTAPDSDRADQTREAPLLGILAPWEVALNSVSRLGVVFALSLALILILGHQLVGGGL